MLLTVKLLKTQIESEHFSIMTIFSKNTSKIKPYPAKNLKKSTEVRISLQKPE